MTKFLLDKFETPRWKRALKAFKHFAERYRAKYNRPPIVIYDNINRLARMDQDILYMLQDDAKDNADKSNYIAVFVASEGVSQKIMMCKYSF